MSNQHEKLLLRYLTALDDGDLDTLSEILRMAEADSLLAQHIQGIHEAYELYVNGYHKKDKIDMHPQTTRRNPSRLVSAVAAVLTLFLIGIVFAIQVPAGRQTQPPPFSLENLQPITAENISQIQPLLILGKGVIHSVAWSPDGKTIALSGTTGIHLHDAADLNAPSTLLGGQSVPTGNIQYSSDGTRLIGIRDFSLWVWDSQTGEVLHQITDADMYPYSAAISRDNNRVAAWGCLRNPDEENPCLMNYVVRVWDVQSGEQITEMRLDGLISLAISPDLNYFFYTTNEGKLLYLADLAAQTSVLVDGTGYKKNAATFSADEQQIAYSFGNDVKVQPLEETLANPYPEDQIEGALFTLSNTIRIPSWLAFRKDNTELLVGYNDGQLLVLTAPDFNILRPVSSLLTKGGTYFIYGTYILNNDGTQVITRQTPGVIRLWDINTGTEIDRLVDYGPMGQFLSFSGDSHKLAASDYEGIIRLWDISQTPPIEQAIDDDPTNKSFAVLNSDGTQIVYTSGVGQMRATRLMREDLLTGETTILADWGDALYRSFVFDPSDTLIAIRDGTRVYRFEGDQFTQFPLINQPSRKVGFFNSIGISPDGRLVVRFDCNYHLATGCENRQFGVWDAITGDPLMALAEPEHNGATPHYNLNLSPDGRYLVSSYCTDVEPEMSSCIRTLLIVFDLSPAYAMLDGESSGGEVQQYQPIFSIAHDGYPFISPVISPNLTDGKILVIASQNQQMFGWQIDPATGDYTEVDVPGGLRNATFTYNPQGTVLAGSSNGVITLWGIPQ